MRNETYINNINKMLETAKSNAEFAQRRIAELTIDINFANEPGDISYRNYQVRELAKYLNRIAVLEAALNSDVIDIPAESLPKSLAF